MTDTNGKSGLTRAQILAAIDMHIQAVPVPEWDGTVYVRNMTGKARDAFESSRYKMVKGKAEVIHNNTRASLLAATLCDEQGLLLFSMQDIEALGEKNGAVLDRLFDIAREISGLKKSEEDLAERIKNSESAPNASSGT